jgi:PEP-CTERM motif
MSSSDNGAFVTINLNAAGLSALNVARGGMFATGGNFSASGVVFRNFDNILSDTSLVYEVSSGPAVPEPTTMVMFGIGALGMGLVARRRKKHSNAQ